jgi:hypothetical protein
MPNLKITLEGDVLGGADFACFHVRNCYPCRDVGAHVSIQATGQGSTANGIRYQNEYFFVLRTRSNDDGESHIIKQVGLIIMRTGWGNWPGSYAVPYDICYF